MSKSDKSSNSGTSMGMIVLLASSVFMASANTVLFKITLNAFSSPTTNYGFFVSQASTLLYLLQALSISAILLWNNPSDNRDLTATSQPIFMYMGTLDGASSTLTAIAGAACPGALQTILNQMVIPITMISAFFFLGDVFETYQISGSMLIFLGSCLASSNYFFAPSSAHSNGASIAIYFLSVIPSALSNIYKERKMKEEDMNEVHVSTMVSFYQLFIGFLFLPLMILPQLGGLNYEEMKSQLSDGFTCFLGTNPRDPSDDGCSNAAALFMVYVVLNFVYNVMMLSITKNGSAVLLVTSQALSLPITNIAFTLKVLMGKDAKPLSMLDLAGLVLVCIGFVAYSGFGFAQNFMVAQGPPGQMAYAHFEDQDEIVVNTRSLATDPEELIRFVVGAMVEAHRISEEKLERQHQHQHQLLYDDILCSSSSALELVEQNSNSTSMTRNYNNNNYLELESSALVLHSSDHDVAAASSGGALRSRSSSSSAAAAVQSVSGGIRRGSVVIAPLTQLQASEAALEMLLHTVAILQKKIDKLKAGGEKDDDLTDVATSAVVYERHTSSGKPSSSTSSFTNHQSPASPPNMAAAPLNHAPGSYGSAGSK